MTVSGSSNLTFYGFRAFRHWRFAVHGQCFQEHRLQRSGRAREPEATAIPLETAYGIDVVGSTNVSVTNSQFHNLRMGLVFQGGNSDITVSNNSFVNDNRLNAVQCGLVDGIHHLR